VRQPQVARGPALRLALLVLALLLAAPVLGSAVRAVVAAAFLAELLTDGAIPALARFTRPPTLRPAGPDTDLHAASDLGPARPLVLVHGYAPEGRRDARVRAAADRLARAGFDVLVPTVPGLTAGRLRPADVDAVVAALASRSAPTVLVAVSVGAGPALLAAADARVRDRVTLAVTLGGYASAHHLLRFYLTGEHGFGDVRGRVPHDPAVVGAFLAANADVVGDGGPALAGDAERAATFLAALPRDVALLLDRLSPATTIGDVRARLRLVHGIDDVAVPFTESLRLAAARPRGTRVTLVKMIHHVEPGDARAWARAATDVLALWSVVYTMLAP
jgi:pimeloyl-ACP methyl ester carboxylesterase